MSEDLRRDARATTDDTEAHHTDQPDTDQPDTDQPGTTAEPTEAGSGRRGAGAVAARWSSLGTTPYLVIAFVIAVLPAVLMLNRVREATRMPYVDYWGTLLRVTTPSGGLHARGLLTYNNEHPFVVPNTIYYLTARFLHGSNQALGFYTIAVAVITVVLLWRLLPAQWPPLGRAALTIALSALVFCPSGMWNFVRGMSGAAWLSANLFAVLAIYLAVRGWTVVATVAAGLSVITYGTGFAAPLAIIAVALLLRTRWWRWALPAALFVVAAIVYKLTVPPSGSGTVSHNLSLLGSTFLSNLGIIWDPTGGAVGRLAGAIGLAFLVVTLTATLRGGERMRDLAPWWGLAVYSIIAAGLISLARSDAFEGDGAQGRYVSLSALFWIAVIVVALRVVLAHRTSIARVAVVAVVIVVSWTAGNNLITQAISLDPLQRVLAAAVRAGDADPFAVLMTAPSQQIPRIKALGDYPFTKDYDYGCPNLGPGAHLDRIDGTLSTSTTVLGAVDTDKLTGGLREVDGWIDRRHQPVNCVLLVDNDNKIVGGGAWGFNRPDVTALNRSVPPEVGFRAVAPSSEQKVRLVLGYDDGYFVLPLTTK